MSLIPIIIITLAHYAALSQLSASSAASLFNLRTNQHKNSGWPALGVQPI